MVKRIFSIGIVLFIVFCLACPALAVDEVVYPIDVLGVGFYRENRIDVVARNGILKGSDFSGFVTDLTARYKPDYFKIYIPVTSSDYNYVYVTLSSPYTTGTYSVDYGTFSNNDFTSSGSATFVRTLVGYTNVYGVNYLSQRFKITVPDSFGGLNSTFFCISCPVPSVGFKLADTELGQEINATWKGQNYWNDWSTSLSDLKEVTTGTVGWTESARSLTVSSVYVNGKLREYYGSGTSDYTTVTLGGTATSASYLQIPSRTISIPSRQIGAVSAETSTYQNASTGNPGSLKTQGYIKLGDTQITGSLSDGVNYADTVVILSAQASNDDSDLIQAVNDASALNHSDITSFSNRMHTDINAFYNRNHNDLTEISNKLGELVQHQQQVEQAGQGIGGTTSTQTITSTSGDLTTGTQALDQSISTVGDISSFVQTTTPYMNLLSIGLGVMWNFGNGVIGWAVLALIVLSVILYILGRISE